MNIRTNLHAGQAGLLEGRCEMCTGVASQIQELLNINPVLTETDMLRLQMLVQKYNMMCSTPSLQR